MPKKVLRFYSILSGFHSVFAASCATATAYQSSSPGTQAPYPPGCDVTKLLLYDISVVTPPRHLTAPSLHPIQSTGTQSYITTARVHRRQAELVYSTFTSLKMSPHLRPATGREHRAIWAAGTYGLCSTRKSLQTSSFNKKYTRNHQPDAYALCQWSVRKHM